MRNCTIYIFMGFALTLSSMGRAYGAMPPINFSVTTTETVNVTGTPRLVLDVGGVTRYATYSSGTGSSTLTFTYSPTVGDIDLDGLAISSTSIDLNSGAIKDLAGNDMSPLTFTLPNTSGVNVSYPSLSMDFAQDTDGRYTLNGTSYNDLSSFMAAASGSFSRSSIGTYYDNTGTLQTAALNVPRFDFDPVTHNARGIFLEESRTNKIYNSYFENWTGVDPANWNNPGGNITKIAGEFGTNAMRITGPFSNSGSRVNLTMSTVSPSTVYTLTVRVKLVSGTGTLALAVDNWAGMAFSFSSASMTAGQYVTLSQTATSSATTNSSGGLHTNGTSAVFDVDYIQLEQGNFATSYIPTLSGELTRQADAFSIPVGTWFNGAEGTFMEASDYTYANNPLAMGVAIHASGNQGYLLYKQASTSQFYLFAGGSQTNIGSISSNALFKAGLFYDASSVRGALNGNLSSTIAPSAFVAPTHLNLYANGHTGHIQSLQYYPIKSSTTQLQLLTQ